MNPNPKNTFSDTSDDFDMEYSLSEQVEDILENDNDILNDNNNLHDDIFGNSTSNNSIADDILNDDHDDPADDLDNYRNAPTHPKKRSKASKLNKILVAAVCVLTFTTVAACACSIFLYKRAKMSVNVIDDTPTLLTQAQYNSIKAAAKKSVSEELRSEMLATIKKRLAAGDSATYLLRQYFPDDIVYTEDGIYKFVPVDKALKPNTLVDRNFKKLESGEIVYTENDKVVSHKGIDISRYQGTVDFAKVKASGVEYAMIRCGYRGYGNGAVVKDSSFDTYAKNANANGMPIGVYFYTQALTVDEAIEEADFVIETIKNYDVSYPVVIDVEEAPVDEYRQKDLSTEKLTEVVAAFCERIKEAGYTPMIYSNIRYFAGKLDFSKLEDYEKWYASYASQPYLPYEFSMWQYTSTGKVDGVSGDVDMNISFKEW